MNDSPPLLLWPDFVHELQALLRNKTPQISLYLVGGSVRDAWLRAEITDVDIAVDGDAIGMARQVADWLDADLFVMDRERGVARVFVQRDSQTILVDFARFRGSAIEDDLRDRDFTVNAMAVDIQGDLSVLIDPLNGAADLRNKILRLCSKNAIASDPIRALRAIRQSTQFGLRIHPDALTQIRQHGMGMRSTSLERIRDEFFKLLGLDNPARALRNLHYLGLLNACIPGLELLTESPQAGEENASVSHDTFQVVERMSMILTAISYSRTDNTAAAFDLGTLIMQLDRFRTQLQAHIARVYGNGRNHRELLVLAALFYRINQADLSKDDQSHSLSNASETARQLRLSNEEEKYLVAMVGNFPRVAVSGDWSDLQRHRFWFQLGESGIDAILLAVAHFLSKHGIELDQRSWLRLVENVTILLDTWFNFRERLVYPDLHLNGDDIMDHLKIERGPAVGKLLSALREAQVLNQVSSAAEAREFITRAHDSLT